MRLERLEMENFRSHSKCELDLSVIDAAAIVGPNGAGKSSLLSAIHFALFGGSPDDLVSRDADKGTVTVTLVDGDKRLRVSRGREKGRKSWLAVERAEGEGEWKAYDTHTIADGQEIVNEAMGMDGEAFAASIYAPQGQAGLLAALSPRDRKALLGGLLGLDQYEDWREQASGDTREVKVLREGNERELERLEREMADLRPRVDDGKAAEAKLESAEDRLRALEAEADAAAERAKVAEQVQRRISLVAQMNELKTRADAAKARQEERQRVEVRVEALASSEERLSGLEEARSAHQTALAARESRQEAVEGAKRRKEAADAEVERLDRASREAAAAFDEVVRAEPTDDVAEGETQTCPTCGQEVEGEHRERARQKVLADWKERWSAAEARAKESQDTLATMIEARERAEREVTEAEAAAGPQNIGTFDEAGYQKVKAEVSELVGLRGQLAGLSDAEDLDDLRKRWAETKAEAEALPESVPEGRTLTDVRAESESQRVVIRELQTRIQRGADAAETVAAISEKVEGDYRPAVGTLAKRERALTVLTKAFSRNGIPAMILDNAVGSIEVAANEILDELGVQLGVRLVTQREKKGGGLTETLDILVDDGSFERPLETYSGGEQYRVHIALRLALARTLAAGTGRTLDFLLIDEPTDLDAGGVEALAALVARLPQQVLLVTHQDELVASMPQSISVTRGADGSRVAVS